MNGYGKSRNLTSENLYVGDDFVLTEAVKHKKEGLILQDFQILWLI